MPDTTRPYVKSTTPLANASGVSISTIIAIEFSERMKSSSLTTNTVGLYRDPTTYTDITISYNDGMNVMMVQPSGYMEVNTRYSMVVSGTVMDYYGNSMLMDYWWNFWTGQPSGYVYASGIGPQPVEYDRGGNIQVVSTTPECYTTDYTTSNISPIYIELTDQCEIGNRNYMCNVSDSVGHTNPAVMGEAFFEDPNISLSTYVSIENNEVLGRRYIDHTIPTYTVSTRGNLLVIDGNGWLDNNEYIVTIRSGLPGIITYPLDKDYSFVFTSTYTPLYAGSNIIRLNIGPMLQMAMAYIPDDTLNRFAYEASIQADRISPTIIDPNNIPWYVEEFVIYQCKLNALYAAIMLFAGSGAGITKTLADFTIAIDARGLMPALLPIIEDYRKLRDIYMGMVKAGNASGPKPVWAIRAEFDTRRPITDNSWRRLPMREVRDESINNSMEYLDQTPKWIYAKDLTSTQYISYDRYLQEGRYVSSVK